MLDFVIIGAGPAGLVLGIELLRQKFKVLIVEKKSHISRAVCGEYLTPEGVHALKSIGLFETIKSFNKLLGMDLISPNGRKVRTVFPEGRYGISLNRKEFQESLLKYYTGLGGEIEFSQDLEKVEQTKSLINLKTTKSNYSAKFLIGADGRLSKTAQLLGIEFENKRTNRVAVHVSLKPKKAFDRFGQMSIQSDGSYIGINPISETEINFSIVTDAINLQKAGAPKEFINNFLSSRKYLRENFNDIRDEKIHVVANLNRTTKKVFTHRCALIGDASGFVDPLTGEGITTAIKTAKILSNLIQSSPENDMEGAFKKYNLLRKKDFRDKERISISFQFIIKYSFLCEIIAHLLNKSKKLSSLFIGVIGNIYRPKDALKILFSKTGP